MFRRFQASRTGVSLAMLACLANPLMLAEQTPAHSRGAWFWQSPASPYGSLHVLGKEELQEQTIARLKAWGVTTLYGSYRGDAVESRAELRAWNAKLARAGIASYLLLSETELFFPDRQAAADEKLRNGFVEFNATAKPEERFQGLAFDIEPHILATTSSHAGWKDATSIQRRDYLRNLLTFYQHVRTNIEPNTQLEATLPVWFSHLGGSVGWNNSAERDSWFRSMSSTCNRVSLMAFEQNSADKVLARSQEERDLLGPAARVALRANLGKEWGTLDDFWQAAHSMEATTRTGIDIQDVAILAAEEDKDKQ
ncbi:MAG: hypothetical protein PW792_14420 [Acidobacteriaceae bacterium]|nr:hypothetical protein [Acidobacteriaceae bacterium]